MCSSLFSCKPPPIPIFNTEVNCSRIETLQLKIKDVQSEKLNGILVSAGQDGVLKYWDLNKYVTIICQGNKK